MKTGSVSPAKSPVALNDKPESGPVSVLYMIDQLTKIQGGGEQALFRIIQDLPRHRFLPSVLTFAASPRSANILRDLHCPLHLFPMSRTYDWTGLKAAIQVFRLLRAQKPHIVHTFFETSNTWGGLITKLSFGPLLVSSRRDMGILRCTKHRIAYTLVNKLCDGVQVVSERVGKLSVENEKISPDKVFTVYNGVEIEKIDKANGSNALEQRLGLADASHIVTTVANIKRVKGLDTFLRAAALVHREFPGAVFVIAGWCDEPDYFDELQELANGLGITDNVRFTGEWCNDVFSLLKLSDVFCLLSRSEGFSNALLEAMASRLPCVVTTVGGNPEAIDDRRNGFLVSPGDHYAAAQRIVSLLRAPDLAAQMGSAARETAEKRFTNDTSMNQLIRLYENLLYPRLMPAMATL